ncbi:MAG: xanthan lyase, partial [Paludibacteraceae bacterium]|nr:xanthan lyase [Paludibacteraceae bacterium]
MKKSFLLAIAALCATMTFAITPQELADSLNVFASERAYLGKVKVSDIQIDEKNITVTTCNRLSCISLTPQEITQLKESVRQWVGGTPTAAVSIISDGKELDEWVTALYKKRDKKLQYKPASAKYPLVHNASQPYSAKQGLDGKHIALWGSHGIYYVQAYRMWKWQRARLWTTIEDLYTSSYTMPFLVPMLENAGAVVLQPRERDTQLNEVIVDDSQLATGIAPAEGSGWGRPLKPLLEGDNPFAMGGYSTVKSTARYTPNLPEAGEYAVYVSYKSLPKSNPQAEYTVVHKGISTTYHVNQQMGGGTWIYLGTFDFGTDGNSNYVALTHKGKHITTTDAIKFGGGWGSVARYPHPEIGHDDFYTKKDTHSQEIITDSTSHKEMQAFATTSGYPRYIEGARYWLQYAGIPDSVYNYTGSKNDYTDD